MASSARQTKGRTTRRKPTARRRFFDYPRSRVKGFRRWLPSWRVVVGTGLTGIALVAGVVIAAYATTQIPSAEAAVRSQTSTVYFADGTTVMGQYAKQKRVIIDFATLPPYVGNAVVASEDRTFWTNSGIDPKGTARALVNNIKGGGRQGGSTLTQQYAERYYSSGTTTDYVGKFREAILAIKISQAQDKEEILGNYLNTIYWGRGSYGIESASQAYFGVPAAQLTISQAAMLSGIIPSPTNWDPAVNPEQAKERWTRTLNLMAEDGYITAAERSAAVFPELKEYVQSDLYQGPDGYLLGMVEKELAGRGISADMLRTRGLNVVTTIDPKLQQLAVTTAQSLPADAAPNLRASLVSLDPKTGAIKALYGGPDAITASFNSVTQAQAQGGSTFKPFALIAALENGHDLSDRFRGTDSMTIKGFDKPVTNFGSESYGNIDLTTATAKSVNTVYAQLNVEVGPDKTAEVAKRAGIATPVEPVPADVLGTTSVHALELANAYATFAANGKKTTPYIVAKVTQLDGSLVDEWQPKPQQVIDPEVMAQATYAMTQVVQAPGGSGAPAKALERPVAGKTGTSNDNKSAWFAGFVPQLTTVVGLYQTSADGKTEEPITPFGGYTSITGGSWPVEAWTQYMQGALQGVPVEEFPKYTPKRPVHTQAPTKEPTKEPTDKPTNEPTKDPAPAKVTIPGGLLGKPAADVKSTLQALGLKVSQTEEYSDKPKGTVIKVQGGAVQVGATVAVVVSKGTDPADQPTEPPPTTPPPTDEPTTEPPPPDPTDEPTDTPSNQAGGNGGSNNNGGGRGDRP